MGAVHDNVKTMEEFRHNKLNQDKRSTASTKSWRCQLRKGMSIKNEPMDVLDRVTSTIPGELQPSIILIYTTALCESFQFSLT